MIAKPLGNSRYTRRVRALSILYQIVVGLSLLTLPWSRLWQDNWLMWQAGGTLRGLLLSGMARGAVSGLGAGILLQAVGWSFASSPPGVAPRSAADKGSGFEASPTPRSS